MREKRLLIVVLLAVMQSLGMCVLGVERGVEVSGKVVDSGTGEGLEMVAVRLFSYGGTDSTLVGGCQTDVNGRFRLLNVSVGSYRLYVSSLGYKERILELRVGEKGKDIGVVKLDEEVEVLSEVVVSGHAAEMTVKGDTLEYNTAAYDVGEGAVVEDLLKKMSGVEVDKDGKVTVNGEQVTGIRVDGKKFFGDDVQSATKNIPADMIEKVQVIDEKSEMSKLTGFDDDDGERIINLKLKENKKKGLFGNFSLGAGADMVADNGKWFGYNKRFMSEDWRYNGGLFMNIMSGESQTTIIGGGNNTNELRTGRGRGGMSGSGSGITWQENIGVNTNIAGRGGWMYGGDVSMTHLYNDTRTKGEKEEWTDEYRYKQNDSVMKESRSWDVRGRLEFEWKIDSMNSLTIKPEISYTNLLSGSYKEYDYYRDSVRTTRGSQRNDGKSRDIGGQLKLIYNHKFWKRGRTLTLRGSVNIDNVRSEGRNVSNNWTVDGARNVDQWTDKDQSNLSYELRGSYVEPIWKTSHFIETALSYSQSNRWSDKEQYADSARKVLDVDYSNRLKNIYLSESLELNYKWVEKLFELMAGVKVNPSQTLSRTIYGSGEVSSRDNYVWNFSPNMSFKYKMGKKNFVRLQYRGVSSQPSISQMEPVRDNSNAMSETVGNLGLLPSFKHSLRLMYSKFNEDRFSSMMAGIRGELTKDALVGNSIYDETGKLYQQTVNAVALPYSVNGDLMYNTPFYNKMFQFNTRTAIGYSRRISYILREKSVDEIESMIASESWLRGEESKTGNMRLSEDLSLRFTHKIVDIGLKGSVSYSRTWNNLSELSRKNVLDWSVTGDLALHLPKGWEIKSDIGYTDRLGYGKELGDLSEVMWNMSLSKSWGNGTLMLKAYDLLNEKKNVLETVGENYVEYKRYNTLPTYFMLTFTYKLNKMGDLKAKGKAGRMQEMLEGGDRVEGMPPRM